MGEPSKRLLPLYNDGLKRRNFQCIRWTSTRSC